MLTENPWSAGTACVLISARVGNAPEAGDQQQISGSWSGNGGGGERLQLAEEIPRVLRLAVLRDSHLFPVFGCWTVHDRVMDTSRGFLQQGISQQRGTTSAGTRSKLPTGLPACVAVGAAGHRHRRDRHPWGRHAGHRPGGLRAFAAARVAAAGREGSD
ncbi:Protein of unknown function [Gryllus bimaculatus]|nr:Protein of unknown function [Gryllus bimaculatus]